jgi:hypothetical protein
MTMGAGISPPMAAPGNAKKESVNYLQPINGAFPGVRGFDN